MHKIINISEQQRQRAKQLYEFKTLKGSVTGGKGNIYGALGEIIVHDYYKDKGNEVKHIGNYDYDLLIDRYKIDVKSKVTSVEPKLDYNCCVYSYNTKQKCDFYLFTRIHYSLEVGYILGAIQKDMFYKNAIFNKKDEYDGHGYYFLGDCYNLKIKQLTKIA